MIKSLGLLGVGNGYVTNCYSFVELHFNNETLTDFYCDLKHTKLINSDK